MGTPAVLSHRFVFCLSGRCLMNSLLTVPRQGCWQSQGPCNPHNRSMLKGHGIIMSEVGREGFDCILQGEQHNRNKRTSVLTFTCQKTRVYSHHFLLKGPYCTCLLICHRISFIPDSLPSQLSKN